MTQLTPAQQSFVDAQVAAGVYPSSTDVVEAALSLLQQRHHEYDQMATAVAQIKRGEVAELDVADIKARPEALGPHVMGRVLRSSQALADLDGIWSYIASDNVAAADRLIDQLYDRFQLLADHPDLGELQPALADGQYRRFTHRNYVIYYLPDDDGIVLARVLHGARDEKELL